MKNRHIIKMVSALAAVALSGCVKEYPTAQPEPADNDAVITVTIPGQQTPSTRSIADTSGEAHLATVDILVFKTASGGGSSAELVQHVRGRDIIPTGGTDHQVQFSAKLWSNPAASTVVLVANVSDVANLIGTQTDKRAILSRLVYASANPGGTTDGWKWNADASDYTPVPMYGEYAIASGGVKAGMKIEGVQLRRMLARIDIENQASQFTLSDVYLVNYNTAGYVAPAWNASTGDILRSGDAGYPYDTNGAPLMPSPAGAKIEEANALRYPYPNGGLKGEIYTYEASASTGAEGTSGHTDAACLIVRGSYGGTTYFYRIDFTAGTDAAGKRPGESGFNPATVKYMPLYRNHRYAFTINSITGPGYASMGDAINSAGIMNNLKVSLLVVDESSIKNIVFDNNHYLGVGDPVTLNFTPTATASVAASTNHPSGWQIDTGKGIGGIEYISGGTDWLRVTKSGSSADLKANIDMATLLTNSSGTPREADICLKAGTLTTKVRVKQEIVNIQVSPAIRLLPSDAINYQNNAVYPISVSCTDSQGNQVDEASWTLSTSSSWLTFSLIHTGLGAKDVPGNGSRTVYLFAAKNTSATTTRTATITRNRATAVNVTQLVDGSETPASPTTYVGAFWRANQTGERLIRIPVTAASAGAWKAEILQYGDFAPEDIVFSSANSLDGNVWTASENIDMNTPGNDAMYSVAGNATFVSGTAAANGNIFFRIGLKTKWSAHPAYNVSTRPARYAVVVIWYNNSTKFQKLYLRQGHEADFLMRPGDPNGSGAVIDQNRSDAKKFMPYNLTEPRLKYGTAAGGTAIGNHPTVPARTSITADNAPNYFTAYPSQAGAFFQWANVPYARKAYHPTNPTTGTITGWQNNSPSAYWNTLGDDHETCPPGYRRPNDGTTSAANSTGVVASSEMRQSLWLNPVSGQTINLGNSVWGYYADGFFDRRQIVASTGTNPTAASAVAATTVNAAYIGRLFFNPHNNASLFIPASGYRTNNTNGQLSYAGTYGFYWSSSANSTTYGWHLVEGSDNAYQYGSNRSYGLSVRCVSE